MAQKCNSEVSGMYDVCGARVVGQSGLVKSEYSQREIFWGYWNCIHYVCKFRYSIHSRFGLIQEESQTSG